MYKILDIKNEAPEAVPYKFYSLGSFDNDEDNVFSQNFVTFVSFGMSKKKKYLNDKIEVEAIFDGYFPPGEEGGRDIFEFEDKFKVSYQLTDKFRVYNLGEISKLQGKEFYKAKIGFEYSF